jgi:trimeric autotransporter adhesin
MKTKILSGLICCLGIYSATAQTITAPLGTPLTITNSVDVTLATGNVNVPADGSFNIGTKKILSTKGLLNLLIGENAGIANTGDHNVFIGSAAGQNNTSGIYNLFLGGSAGSANTTGTQNIFMGGQAGFNNTIGYDNVFLGLNSGLSNTVGHSNLFMGTGSGGSNTSGIYNTFIGKAAGGANTTGTQNTFIGGQAGYNNTIGFDNFFIGLNAGYSNLGGHHNLFIGNSAGGSNTSGIYNTFIGPSAGGATTTGTQNTFIGGQAGNSNTTGQNNLFMGLNSGFNNLTGSDNVFIGNSAGGSNTSGSSNTFIGSGSTGSAALTNATAIGANASVTSANTVVIGSAATVVIGATGASASPAKLEVTGSTPGKSGIKCATMATGALSGPGNNIRTGGFLTVNTDGEIVWAATGASRLGNPDGITSAEGTSTFSDNNWSFSNGYLKNTSKRGVVIGEGITSMPEGYSFYVADGILTEKVKVAIKGTDEWADYVFGKNYNRMSLTDVAKYIEKNNHLPNVPSAAEMVQNGNDLHKTDVKLLEKIEELTLYMIEMKKENEQLKKDVDSLKKRRK